jgi:hypothetical protein
LLAALLALAAFAHGATLESGDAVLTVHPDGTVAALAGADGEPAFAGPCPCEGWGVAHAGGHAATRDGAATVPVVSFTNGSGGAVSVVDAAGLRVAHRFQAAALPGLFTLDVTITNPGPAAVAGVHYRRVADFDLGPSPGEETVTLAAAAPSPPLLAGMSPDGAASPDPASPMAPAASGTSGPGDLGGALEAALGCLGPGDEASVRFWYGRAPDGATAGALLVAVGAQAWVLAQSNGSAVHLLAVDGLGGLGCALPDVEAPAAPYTVEPVQLRLRNPLPAGAAERAARWEFGDGATGAGLATAHAYFDDGPVRACAHQDVLSGVGWRSWTACVPLTIQNRPPPASFAAANLTAATTRLAATGADLDGAIVAWAWELPDGTTATGASVDHDFPRGGRVPVCLTATDDDGAATRSCAEAWVAGPFNFPPTLRFIAGRHLVVGTLLNLPLQAYDRDDDALTWTTERLPEGAVIAAGRLAWRPGPGQLGPHEFVVTVHDPYGGAAARTVVVLVDNIARDSDQDGIADFADLCAGTADAAQVDLDADLTGDACDPAVDVLPPRPPLNEAPLLVAPSAAPDPCDGLDRDRDGLLDACDDDPDGDGIPSAGFADNCPLVPNLDQQDRDGDGLGDACALPAEARALAAPRSLEPYLAPTAAPAPAGASGLAGLIAFWATLGLAGAAGSAAWLRKR